MIRTSLFSRALTRRAAHLSLPLLVPMWLTSSQWKVRRGTHVPVPSLLLSVQHTRAALASLRWVGVGPLTIQVEDGRAPRWKETGCLNPHVEESHLSSEHSPGLHPGSGGTAAKISPRKMEMHVLHQLMVPQLACPLCTVHTCLPGLPPSAGGVRPSSQNLGKSHTDWTLSFKRVLYNMKIILLLMAMRNMSKYKTWLIPMKRSKSFRMCR